MYQYRSDHNAVFDQPQWNIAWRADIGDRNNGGLSIVGDTVYVESFAHKLFAFDAQTGRLRWEQKLDNVAMATSVVGNGMVYAGTGSPGTTGSIYAVDASSGQVRWTFKTQTDDMASGIVLSNQFIFNSSDRHVRSLNAQTGRATWNKVGLGNVTMASLGLYEGRIYGVANARGSPLSFYAALEKFGPRDLLMSQYTWAMRPQDGRFLWASPYGDYDGTPTAAAGVVFVEGWHFGSKIVWTTGPWVDDVPIKAADPRRTEYSSEVDALSSETGTLLWSYASKAGPYVADGSAIRAIPGMYAMGVFYESLPYAQEFAAFDARTGKLRWKIGTQATVRMGAVLKDGRLFFGDTGGVFYVVNSTNGRIERTIKFPGIFGCSPPVIVGSTLFVTNGSVLYALRLSDLQAGKLST